MLWVGRVMSGDKDGYPGLLSDGVGGWGNGLVKRPILSVLFLHGALFY